MKNKNIKNGKPGHQDDCQDCRREKKENEALIAIYQRLQAVDGNSKLMRKSLQKHKQEFESTNSKFKQFTHRFNELPKESKADAEFKNLGLDMAQAMVEEVTRGAVVRDNQRLKNTLVQMYKPKLAARMGQDIPVRRSLSVSTDYEHQQNRVSEKLQANEMRRSFLGSYEPDLRKSSPIEQIKEVREPEETRTTGFFSQENHNTTKLDGLNLWLYQQNESKSLEEELYQTRMPSRHRLNKVIKVKGTVLPALRSPRTKN